MINGDADSIRQTPMDDIIYYDRYRNRLCTELVYGDKSLRWTYGTVAGRLALHAIVKRALFSRWYGWSMNRTSTKSKIKPFIKKFAVDESEFAQPTDSFKHFNDFFYRRLTSEARPIAPDPAHVVFPADGRHLCVPNLSRCDGLFVKGEMFDVVSLLRDDALAKKFREGSLLMSRLCPTDYHRFHFPFGGTPGKNRLINGPLYSVNPIALCENIQILATNKRAITQLRTSEIGTILLIEVGATCVGSIQQTYEPDRPVKKGDEKGFFRFGGSCTLTLFEAGRIRFSDDLIEHSSQHRELYAKFGDTMGTVTT